MKLSKSIKKQIYCKIDFKKNEKNLNQFQNGLIHIRRIPVKKVKGRTFFKPKKYKI